MHGPTCVRPSNAQKARTALLVVMSPRTPSMSRKEHSSLQTTQKRQYRGERSGAAGAAGAPRRGWSVPHVNSQAHPILSLRGWGSHPCTRSFPSQETTATCALLGALFQPGALLPALPT